MDDVALHIGTHRTGTTSLQRLLADHRDDLLRAGIRFPEGAALPDNHLEVWFASMRSERLRDLAAFLDWALERLEHPIRSCRDPAWFEYARDRIRHETGERLVYSCEGLSLLRYSDEVERLKELFSGAVVDVVVVHRDPAEFLESYRWAMQVLGNRLSDDPDSPMYTEPDSWLVDYDARVSLWRAAVGEEHIHVVDYDACNQGSGTVVPAVLCALGIDPMLLDDRERYHLNARR